MNGRGVCAANPYPYTQVKNIDEYGPPAPKRHQPEVLVTTVPHVADVEDLPQTETAEAGERLSLPPRILSLRDGAR